MTDRKIVTSHVYPPIPVRNFDWSAYYEGDEEAGQYGYGATEAEAIADFIENFRDDCDLRLDGKCACPYCFESSGYEARYIPATWYEPAWEDTDYSRPCEHCNGTGVFVAKERFTPAQSEAEEIVF
jgi:hypothetical protein